MDKVEAEDSKLQLVYRKDGIVNLITLVAKDVDIAKVSVCVCVCTCVCVSELSFLINNPRAQSTYIAVVQSFIINSNIITDCQ